MKIDRLLSIVMILLERKKVSAFELARTFEVSARTIYRDVETINQAGLPVVAYPGVRGGIGILESYKPEKRFFSAQDVTMPPVVSPLMPQLRTSSPVCFASRVVQTLGRGMP